MKVNSENKVKLMTLLDDIEKHGSYIRVAGNTLANIYYEDIEIEVIDNINKHTKFLYTLSKKHKESMKYNIKQLEFYSNSIGLSENFSNEAIKELINDLTTNSEKKLVSIVKTANDTYDLIKLYGGLDLEKSSGFYEEVIKALIVIQEKSIELDELFMELCNSVYDKLNKDENEPISSESVNDEIQSENKDKYWALESFGDVIDYDNQEVINKVIPLAVFKEKPTYEELTDYFFFGDSGWTTDKADIELLLETGESYGEFGRQVHLPYAKYKLIECKYD